MTDASRSGWHWSLRRWITATVLMAAIVVTLAIVSGAVALVQLGDARDRVISHLDPASRASDDLGNALINEETGVRGYALSRKIDFLEPYSAGVQDERASIASMRLALGSRFPTAISDLDAVIAASAQWKADYAQPTIDRVKAGDVAGPTANVQSGKDLFDQIRTAVTRLSTHLNALRTQAVSDLHDAAQNLIWVAVSLGAALIAGVIMLAIGLRRGVSRPVVGLAAEVRIVAAGDYDRAVRTSGPSELVNLGDDVEEMRQRILAELSATREAHATLDQQTRDLQRSNTELEQFAYVASHDLQEPLRKVTSFCQLIDDRYHDKLDDRGRQYIEFAVDGATRMQTLINDLLAFSRVGRLSSELTVVDLNEAAAEAISNLGRFIEDTGATVDVDPLPHVRGDASLLAAVFQNLINNGIKFRSADELPAVHVTVRADRDFWLFTCRDNGIGIESEYVERIFVIFQRLHPKDRYPGTGIGLSMCRKIIEYHGGRIWLDPDGNLPGQRGSTFRFTLPRMDAGTSSGNVADSADFTERAAQT